MDDGDWSTTNDAKALDVDADGSIVVAGLTRDDSDNTDAYLVRYDADGRRMWTVRYNSPSNAADWISVVRAAPDGSTYAAGDSFHKGWNALSLKIDNDGNVLWLRHDRAEDSYVAEASLIDDAGNFYFAGTVYPGTMLLQKISGDGDLLWTVGTAGAAAKMMAWESSGDLVVAGKIAAADEYSDATNDIFLAKYAPDGDLRWTAEFKEFGESESGATGLAIEEDGSIVVSGGSQRADDPSAHDALMLSYRPDGGDRVRILRRRCRNGLQIVGGS
ncbi:MAG: hypothetical protein M5R36_04650 [Deltaproteobacteria bacterium]|nr:hypothetical protein [Deltaproteobacteria bacterium]